MQRIEVIFKTQITKKPSSLKLNIPACTVVINRKTSSNL